MLIFETDEEVDDFHDKKWYCDMNQDRSHSKCKTPEKDAAWYSVNMRRLISLKARQENESHSNNQATSLDAVVPLSDPAKDAAVLEKTKQMIENDVILKKLGTLQLIDNHSSNEINTSSAEEPNQRKSIASKLFGKIYFPDLLSTHSTKDLDAAASYQKLLEDRAAADLKSVRDHDAAASHLQSLEESADKQMLFSPSGVGNWAMDTTVQVDKPESTQRVQQTSTNMASLTQLMDSQAKVVTPMMNQSNNHEPSITLGMPASDKLTNKLTTTNIGMGRPLVANKTLVTDELMQHALTAHIIAIDASGRQSREAVAEKSDKRDTQKRVLIEKSVREGKEQMQGFKAKNCSKGRKRAELVMNDTSSTVRPASSKESIASGKGNVKSEKREGVRTWGTEEKPLEILSDSDS